MRQPWTPQPVPGILTPPSPTGGVAERPNAAVLKTAVPQGTGGSNPPASAIDQMAGIWNVTDAVSYSPLYASAVAA